MAVKDWRNASHFLKFVITMPPSLNVVSKIMIEAYKKWILVGLLDTGKVSDCLLPTAIIWKNC